MWIFTIVYLSDSVCLRVKINQWYSFLSNSFRIEFVFVLFVPNAQVLNRLCALKCSLLWAQAQIISVSAFVGETCPIQKRKTYNFSRASKSYLKFGLWKMKIPCLIFVLFPGRIQIIFVLFAWECRLDLATEQHWFFDTSVLNVTK